MAADESPDEDRDRGEDDRRPLLCFDDSREVEGSLDGRELEADDSADLLSSAAELWVAWPVALITGRPDEMSGFNRFNFIINFTGLYLINGMACLEFGTGTRFSETAIRAYRDSHDSSNRDMRVKMIQNQSFKINPYLMIDQSWPWCSSRNVGG